MEWTGRFILTFLTLARFIYASDEDPRNDDETRLMQDLFRKYKKEVRPAVNSSQPVRMTFGLAYVQLVKLDDREQTLISNVWIRQRWHNYHLRWDPTKYANITKVNVDPLKVWLPDVVLYNNGMAGPGAGTMYKFKYKVELQYDGLNSCRKFELALVSEDIRMDTYSKGGRLFEDGRLFIFSLLVWALIRGERLFEALRYSPAIIRSSCNIDITYFPFDDQFCDLTFGSWTFSGYELDVFRDMETADLAFYQKSAEFDLVSAKAVRKIVRFSCCPTPYPNIVFIIHLRRQPGFFLFNVIIPGLVITCFAILTFTSPHGTGERISLAIESFLSLSFLCLMVADSVPVNSDVSPLITKFLLLCMSLISLAVLFNLVSLSMNDQKRVPDWLRTVAFNYIGPMLGYCDGHNNNIEKRWEERLHKVKLAHSTSRKNVITNMKTEKSKYTNGYDHRVLSNGVTPRKKLSNDCTNHAQKQQTKPLLPKNQHTQEQSFHPPYLPERTEPTPRKGELYPIGVSMQMYHKAVSDMDDVLYRSWLESDGYYNREFWRCLAQTVDRVFMIVFSLSFIFVSAVMLLKGYGHQVSVQNT